MELGVNKRGQVIFEDFKENDDTKAFIKKANEDNEQELNGYELYEY